MGNEQTYPPPDGAVHLPVSEDPISVEGPVDDVSMGAPVSLSAPNGTQGESIAVTVTNDGGLSGELAFRGTGDRVSLPEEETTVDVQGSTYAELRTIHADVLVDGNRVGHVQASSVVKGEEYPRESAGPPGSSANGGDAGSDGGAGDGGQDANDGAGGGGGANDGGDAGDGDGGVGAPGFGVLAGLLALLGAGAHRRRRR
jgi:hypothetical protein